MNSILWLIDNVVDLYIWVLIASAIMSWLIAFNIVNTYNRFVYLLNDFLMRLTEPALAQVRRVIPRMGGVDLSPVVLILLLAFARNLLFEYVG